MTRPSHAAPAEPPSVEPLDVPALAADRDKLLSRFILALVLDEPRWKAPVRRVKRRGRAPGKA